jgi:hypothetical protein
VVLIDFFIVGGENFSISHDCYVVICLLENNTKNAMNKEIEKKSLSATLKLRDHKPVKSAATQETSNNSRPSSKEDTIALPSPESKHDFNAIYDILHGKFPEIINLSKPVLLAVGIRKEMSKETDVSNVILKRWIAWYCSKSNYYAQHKQGATRFNLDGSKAGIVTEKHQEKMDKRLEKTTNRKTPPDLETKDKDSDNDLSGATINDVK